MTEFKIEFNQESVSDLLNATDALGTVRDEIDSLRYIMQERLDYLNLTFVNLKEQLQCMETFCKQQEEAIAGIVQEITND